MRLVRSDCRECGIEVELDDIPVDSLVPEPLQATDSVSKFMEELPKYDGDMAAQLEEADAAGECLRFVGMHFFQICLSLFYIAAHSSCPSQCKVQEQGKGVWLSQQFCITEVSSKI